ncbi:hypothetical protein, partial [Escherichia coli]
QIVFARTLDDQAVSHAVPFTETHLAGQRPYPMLCARTDNHQGTGNVVTSAHMTRANDDDAGAAGIGAVAHMTTVDDNYTGHVERGKA